MTNKKFHRSSNFCLTPKTAKLVILEWSYVFSFLVWLYAYLLLLILKRSCVVIEKRTHDKIKGYVLDISETRQKKS